LAPAAWIEGRDRVVIHWRNSVEMVELYFACFKSGMIAVTVNDRLNAREIAYILRHSKAKLCFSQPELSSVCEEALSECEGPLRIYTALPPLETMESGNAALPEITPHQVAAILYTSGSTARPKGVIHTHSSLIASARLVSSLGVDETKPTLYWR
jgi:acyl-CoA synthetase (AMP-forming)/AMP-acid ligase II